jgi:hypothetical protein
MSRLPAWRFRAPFEDFAGKLTGSRAREEANDCIAMTAKGQSRRSGGQPPTSGLPLETDIVTAGRHVSKVPQPEVSLQSKYGAEFHEADDHEHQSERDAQPSARPANGSRPTPLRKDGRIGNSGSKGKTLLPKGDPLNDKSDRT